MTSFSGAMAMSATSIFNNEMCFSLFLFPKSLTFFFAMEKKRLKFFKKSNALKKKKMMMMTHRTRTTTTCLQLLLFLLLFALLSDAKIHFSETFDGAFFV